MFHLRFIAAILIAGGLTYLALELIWKLGLLF